MFSLLQATHVQDDVFNEINTKKQTKGQGIKSPQESEQEHLEQVTEGRKGFNGINHTARWQIMLSVTDSWLQVKYIEA